MTTTIRSWGNSLGVRIPKRIADNLSFSDGTKVNIVQQGDKIIIERAKKKPTLDDLLAKCVGENPHPEYFSEPMGREEI